MAKEKVDPLLAELETIRKLLVLAMLRGGVTQSQMAGVLGTSQASVSRMFPSGALEAFNSKKAKKSAAKQIGPNDGGI